MAEIPILSRNDDRRLVQHILGHYDAPAFIRRARRVQEMLDALIAICRRQRDQWLTMPRLRLGALRDMAGDWNQLRPWLIDEDQIIVFRDLENQLAPRLRIRIEPTALLASLETFNRRWLDSIPTLDLTPVNEARDGYNRYYLLEKECAMRSSRLARLGFKRLEPFTTHELMTMLPSLPIPKLVQ